MNKIAVNMPFDKEYLCLRKGDSVSLSGCLLTGRDAAHKRLFDLIERNEKLPVNLHNKVIYYTGPCPTPPGQIIGSCGPTTSSRMDKYTPKLLELGIKGMIGKGPRSIEVVDSIVKNSAIYFAAIGGAGALIARCVKEARIIAFEDLGAEAIYELYIENMPLIVAIDSIGGNIYKNY